uniref:Uncharacterized protein LOC116945813 isoform X6 n=1 Tax=Petromyzon marinus TaxID=7757 RepID=A0AAJ7TF49_PETMA|nr:uncharacterized protein LOC116945813 isoform X6 [Petromyzon marinus]
MCAMNLQSEERLLARDEWLAVIASRRDRCRRVHPSCINSQPGGPCLLTSVEALQSISRIDGIDRLSLCITPSKPGATVWARARNLAARCGFSNSGCGVSVAPTPLQRGHNAKLPGGACNGVSSKNRRSPLLGGTGRLAERQPERRFAAQGGAAAPRRTRPNVCSESCPACRRSGTCRRPRTSGAEGQQIITLLQNDVQEQGGGGGEAEGRRGTTGHRAAGDSGPAPAVQPAGEASPSPRSLPSPPLNSSTPLPDMACVRCASRWRRPRVGSPSRRWGRPWPCEPTTRSFKPAPGFAQAQMALAQELAESHNARQSPKAEWCQLQERLCDAVAQLALLRKDHPPQPGHRRSAGEPRGKSP